MFYSEFYANRIAAIEAEINRNRQIASLISSPYDICRKKAKRAIKRIETLTAQIDSMKAAAACEAALEA